MKRYFFSSTNLYAFIENDNNKHFINCQILLKMRQQKSFFLEMLVFFAVVICDHIALLSVFVTDRCTEFAKVFRIQSIHCH